MLLCGFLILNYFSNIQCRRDDALDSKLNFNSVEATINRLKSKKCPELPAEPEALKKAFEDPETLNKFGMNLINKDRLFLHGEVNENFSYQIFASIRTIDFIKRKIAAGQRRYLIDGTFKIVPKPFSQVLIISIEYRNNVSLDGSKINGHINHKLFSF